MPPMEVPWPPMNLVAEWITMSAPHSIGRHRYGVANVLSTISGRSWECAMAATVSMSSTFPAGLPIVSAKNAFVFGRTACPPGVRIVGVDPGQLHVHLAQQVLELVDGPAVEGRGRDDVVARLEQGEQRGRLRGDPARERHPARAALQVRDPLLEHRHGRVHDPRVRVPVLLQVEVGRGRLRVLEHVAGGLEDRHRAGARVGVGPLPGVQLPGLESERAIFLGPVLVVVGHERILFLEVTRRPAGRPVIGIGRRQPGSRRGTRG